MFLPGRMAFIFNMVKFSFVFYLLPLQDTSIQHCCPCINSVILHSSSYQHVYCQFFVRIIVYFHKGTRTQYISGFVVPWHIAWYRWYVMVQQETSMSSTYRSVGMSHRIMCQYVGTDWYISYRSLVGITVWTDQMNHDIYLALLLLKVFTRK